MARNLACGFIGLAVGVEGGTGGYLADVVDIATAIANKECTIEVVCDFRSVMTALQSLKGGR